MAEPATSNQDLWQEIDASISAREERLRRLRRLIHAVPEPSGEETATTRLVADTLRDLGLQPQIMAGGVGVIADLEIGSPSGTFIALRSELDCVDVTDDKQVPYASTRPGACHACGHDVHTAINLGVAATLIERRDALRAMGPAHNIRFVFQPAEEAATGARSMIQQGAIDGVEAIIALHVDPFLETGQIGLRQGPITSACKSFEVLVNGRGGHSARPFEAVDPIPAATNIVNLFYELAPRSIDGRSPLALTVCAIDTGQAMNAIADRAIISGTLRATRTEDMEAVQRRMYGIVNGMAEATGCEVELRFGHSCPPTDNDAEVLSLLANVDEIIGEGNCVKIDAPSLGGEDFAFFQELIPGAFIRLGAAFEDPRSRRPLHSSLFDVNEGSLACGTRVMTFWAIRLAFGYESRRA